MIIRSVSGDLVISNTFDSGQMLNNSSFWYVKAKIMNNIY